MRAAVVIPTYNRARMLDDALASLDAQDERCQVYVYDDGSDDSTALVASGHDAAYIRKEHAGSVTLAFNRAVAWALRRTDAEYIAWLGSDDAYTADSVRLRADMLSADPSLGMVFSGLRFVPGRAWETKRGRDSRIDVTRYGQYLSAYSRNVHTGTAMFRREVWKPWREEIRLGGADLLWVYECVNSGVKPGYVDKTLYHCRMHKDRNIHAWRSASQEEKAREYARYMEIVEEVAHEGGDIRR